MDQAIANRFYEYRKKSGLSQEELAARLGISRQSVSKWERGEASPDTENLIRLARIYGVSLDDLVNGIVPDEPKKNTDQSPRRESDREEPQAAAEENTAAGGEEKTNVHISWKDGVHVVDGKDAVHIDANGVTAVENGSTKQTRRKESFKRKKNHVEFPIDLITVVAFCYLGFAHGLWHPAWLLFLLIPIVHGLGDAIRKRKFVAFPVPLLALAVFLCLGFFWGMWNPGWVAFLLIPVYYPVASWLDREISGEDFEP